MIQSLSSAATALEAQQQKLANISNDIANSNTDGFKKSRTEFQDLLYTTTKEPGAMMGNATQSPVGVQSGLGVKVAASHKIFDQGPARMTGRPLDLMVEGSGFFPVQMPNGEVGYSRVGNFHLDGNGVIKMSSGATLIPQITVPPNAISVQFSPNGEVKATLPDMQEQQLGQIQLITFNNPEGLSSVGGNLYKPSNSSGAPLQGVPGNDGLGVIAQGALEGSNVNVAQSMIDMISTQRSYELGTRALSTADKMLEATVNLK
jgi:flagellar basal-body rod protein FlgG